ncbi:hypothetical protein L211DRAFT_120856 [Terfezia boudieri ATCC MYA-4762]|uniref:Uncharacterized protein n=1 Tax=Terfezia boudieri ATCC MYA-4762 TaxID=1051890 RepID=A0A3N4LR66_9PEZI|nr:hypothetical protein L211DRAFT_120856 [Terfezia boudieri ATCC MYA-4762]
MSDLQNPSTTSSLIRLLQRKRYQYEVTYSLYMLTPMEKFIFNTFLFAFLSMLILAASLYLPQHVATITSRAWFYLVGDGDREVLVR